MATQAERMVGQLVCLPSSVRGQEDILQLYRTLVSELEYCVDFVSLHYRKDAGALESVKKRFTRMLPGLEGINYRERWDQFS